MSEAVEQTKPNGIPTPEELGFDPAVLREKYAAERQKRLRADGNNQYQEITGKYAHFETDPYVEPGFTRPALHEELDVVIIGGGFGGLLAAARLQEVGITNIRIIEKAGDFGGTWYWNRYPGAQCDIESYVYLPLLEETGYIPKEKYSFAPEIFEHAQRIGKHFNLYEQACFQTQITEARWDDGAGRWTVTTDRGDVFKARFVIMSSGPLNRPKLPAIPGIEKFKGHTSSTRVAGTTTTPAATPPAVSTSSPTSAWGSSGPGRPRFSACRISASTRSSSTSSSARRPRWTNAATSRPTRNG